jgi:hypothetical protein
MPKGERKMKIGNKKSSDRDTFFKLKWLSIAAILSFYFICCSGGEERTYYAIEISGNLIGYSETISSVDPDSGHLLKTDTKSVALLTLLEQPFNLNTQEVCHYDPDTLNITHYDADVRAGQMFTGSTITIEGNKAQYIPKPKGTLTTIELESGVLTNEYQLTKLVSQELGKNGLQEKIYRLLDPTRGRILERIYTYIGEEKIIIEEAEHNCSLYGMKDLTLGLSGKIWLDRESRQPIRTHLSDDTVTYLTDAGVRNRIKRASIDNRILAKVETRIPDFQNISHMKVRAIIRSAGEAISSAALNVPGQRFEVTVLDNKIEGVFEISHQPYDGSDAPPFPSGNFYSDPDLVPFLEPELMIESNDPVLIKKAQELTENARDSWEAARLLARWVGTEIAGAIPGGSARQTYDSRKGECGAHSRLFAAFCRAVGIPARMVIGGVYFYRGGGFGQHGWNEVYMGKAGWIPLDATFQEYDYCDSGHIRIGYMTSFQPVELEVLEYKTGYSNQ